MMRLSAFVAVAGIAGSVLADGPTLTGSSAVAAGFSGRSVLINQADGAANGRASQNFGDFPDFTCGAFDDITFGSAVNLTSMTIYGQNSLAGGEAANVSVNYQIRTAPDLVGGTIVASGLGTQLGGVLTFDLTGVSLTAGTYWVTAYVDRPFGTGGQWYWNESSDPVSGSESYWHNPGGGFGAGAASLPGSAVFGGAADLALTIEGNVVPAPGALALLGLGGLAAARRRR